MNWEGDAANEECVDDDLTITTRRKAALLKSRDGKRIPEHRLLPEESEESSSSEDEYVDVKSEHVEQSKAVPKVCRSFDSNLLMLTWTEFHLSAHPLHRILTLQTRVESDGLSATECPRRLLPVFIIIPH